jgi:sterol desaturase/sphingolipid hydroxylase (fatty acid hydroxylase superfamily)
MATTIDMPHFLLEHMRYIVLLGGLTIFIAAEGIAPAMMHEAQGWRHTTRNLLLGFLYFGSAVVLGLGIAWVTSQTAAQHLGLFNAVAVSIWTQLVLGILALDFVEYWRHRFMHEVPFLWRFHRVHHSDPVMETSTTLRNHPLQLLVILAPRAVLIPLLGLAPLTVAIHASVSLAAQLFHHSNVRLNPTFSKWFGLVIVTPDQHYVHHARLQKFTDSQYGVMFIFWDKIFGTLLAGPGRDKLELGLDEFNTEFDHTVAGMLASPLDKRERLRLRAS